MVRRETGKKSARHVLAGLSISADQDCRQVGEIARSHLLKVQGKLAELSELEKSLRRFVVQCDSMCYGGPRRECVVFKEMTA